MLRLRWLLNHLGLLEGVGREIQKKQKAIVEEGIRREKRWLGIDMDKDDKKGSSILNRPFLDKYFFYICYAIPASLRNGTNTVSRKKIGPS